MGKQVRIMVSGGVAYVISIPEGIEVIIEDFDSDPNGEISIWNADNMKKASWALKWSVNNTEGR